MILLPETMYAKERSFGLFDKHCKVVYNLRKLTLYLELCVTHMMFGKAAQVVK